jgi:hypothetical protein
MPAPPVVAVFHLPLVCMFGAMAVPGMLACACDTRTRLCVRCVLCSPAFLSVPSLGSAGTWDMIS